MGLRMVGDVTGFYGVWDTWVLFFLFDGLVGSMCDLEFSYFVHMKNLHIWYGVWSIFQGLFDERGYKDAALQFSSVCLLFFL